MAETAEMRELQQLDRRPLAPIPTRGSASITFNADGCPKTTVKTTLLPAAQILMRKPRLPPLRPCTSPNAQGKGIDGPQKLKS